MSIPRAELFAANINAHTGEIVRRSFGELHVKCTKLTDSQVTLHWINNQELPLKQWPRNRVVDILRFTQADQWKYVKSACGYACGSWNKERGNIERCRY